MLLSCLVCSLHASNVETTERLISRWAILSALPFCALFSFDRYAWSPHREHTRRTSITMILLKLAVATLVFILFAALIPTNKRHRLQTQRVFRLHRICRPLCFIRRHTLRPWTSSYHMCKAARLSVTLLATVFLPSLKMPHRMYCSLCEHFASASMHCIPHLLFLCCSALRNLRRTRERYTTCSCHALKAASKFLLMIRWSRLMHMVLKRRYTRTLPCHPTITYARDLVLMRPAMRPTAHSRRARSLKAAAHIRHICMALFDARRVIRRIAPLTRCSCRASSASETLITSTRRHQVQNAAHSFDECICCTTRFIIARLLPSCIVCSCHELKQVATDPCCHLAITFAPLAANAFSSTLMRYHRSKAKRRALFMRQDMIFRITLRLCSSSSRASLRARALARHAATAHSKL